MKSVLLLLPSLLVGFAFSQTPKEQTEKSKTDLFESRSGILLKKEYFDVGVFKPTSAISKNVEIKVVQILDMSATTKIKAIRMEMETRTRLGTSDTKLASIDADEADAAINAIKLIKFEIVSGVPTNYTETIFRSRSGFELGAYASAKETEWKAYLKLERFDSDSYCFMKSSDLDQLLELFEAAKKKL